MAEFLDDFLRSAGSFTILILGAAALIEYLFPPFPGDMVVLLGGVYAVRGAQPWGLVLVALILGSVLGASIAYYLGARIATHFERSGRTVVWGISASKIHEAQAKMRKWGGGVLLINRFLPGIRGVIFLSAGAARMPFYRVIGLGAVSAAAHALILLGVGMAVGGNLERLEKAFHQYQTGALVFLGIIALAIAARIGQRYRRRSSLQRAEQREESNR